MRSSDIARIAGVTTRTLRHYHAIGLLPEPPREKNGYREYDVMDLTRVLHIKRLATLGFPLSQIKIMLAEEAGGSDELGPGGSSRIELEELDELDEELKARIKQLEQQRLIIAQLREERLDPSLPIRFAKAIKRLYGNRTDSSIERVVDRDRAALLLASHLYDEEALQELERFVDFVEVHDLIEPLCAVELKIRELRPDAPEAERERLISESLELLEPAMECFEPQNWEDSDNEGANLLEAMLNESQNPAQQDVSERIEAAIIERITKRA